MSNQISEGIKKYLYSNYTSDNHEYGFWSLKGRLVSLINIPSNLIRTTLLTSGFLAVGLFKVGAAGLRVTFKVIPFAIMSILPRTDRHYWMNHAATHWDMAKYSLKNAPHRILDAASIFVYQIYWIGLDIVGCTINPDRARKMRLDIAEWCEELEFSIKKNYFYYCNGVKSRNDPLPVDVASLKLPVELQQPMQDIVDALNGEIAEDQGSEWIEDMRHYPFSLLNPTAKKDPSQVTDKELRQWKFAQYFNKFPTDSNEYSIAALCIKRLLNAGVIYNCGVYADTNEKVWIEA